MKTFRPAILPITGRTSGNFDVYVLASITRFIDRSLKNFSRDYTPPLEREREGENSKGGKFQVCCRLIGVYHLFFFYYYFSSAKDSLKTTTSCVGNAFVAPSSRVHVHTGSRANGSASVRQSVTIFLHVCRVQLEIFFL